MEIKLISPDETHTLRRKILRNNSPIAQCNLPGDLNSSTFHLGAILNSKIVGVASFYRENSPLFSVSNQYRLRGMASDSEYRSLGVGSRLIYEGLKMLTIENAQLLWCNARTEAIGFYKKMNFSIIGNEFFIKDIGPHYVMIKQIY